MRWAWPRANACDREAASSRSRSRQAAFSRSSEVAVGTGPWDHESRPSYAKVDRVLEVYRDPVAARLAPFGSHIGDGEHRHGGNEADQRHRDEQRQQHRLDAALRDVDLLAGGRGGRIQGAHET